MGKAVGSALFEFICRASVHRISVERSRTELASASPITVHDGKWAYCSAGATEGHDWRRIAPASLADLKRAEVAKA